jgi:hypothetical protein
MLVEQGAKSFRLWTGQEPPVDAMEAAARAVLSTYFDLLSTFCGMASRRRDAVQRSKKLTKVR